MAYYNTRSAIPQAYYTDVTTSTPQAGLTVAAYDPYAVAPLTIPPTGASVGGPVGAAPLPPQHRSSSGAWNVSDDHMLINARASGKNWGQIQATYFPNKTPNACRKRHERLMERKCADDWDARKLERMAKDYMFLRKEIWAPLAQRTGEKWNVVEQKCMSNGLKNLQAHARAFTRRERLESGEPVGPYDDDSGISGIGLTPVDELDPNAGVHYRFASPAASSSGGGGSSGNLSAGDSSTGSQHHYGAQPMHGTTSFQSHAHQGYGHNYHSSISSTGTAGYANGGPVGGSGATGHGSQPQSPYHPGSGSRMPSVDMGIESIINRPGVAAGSRVM